MRVVGACHRHSHRSASCLPRCPPSTAGGVYACVKGISCGAWEGGTGAAVGGTRGRLQAGGWEAQLLCHGSGAGPQPPVQAAVSKETVEAPPRGRFSDNRSVVLALIYGHKAVTCNEKFPGSDTLSPPFPQQVLALVNNGSVTREKTTFLFSSYFTAFCGDAAGPARCLVLGSDFPEGPDLC